MPPNLRRLAADQAALHDSRLPPYYLFPPENDTSTSADDLSQLTVLLAGPQGTPYSHGLWRIHLRMPEDYPRSPPKASFRTRIWHPNVEESTGSVCVDTLKRDWASSLTLKDVLVTISCLLIHPNPDSALNSTAGALLQEDYDAFSRHAEIMTSIHAPVPDKLSSSVKDAKLRGEDDVGTVIQEQRHEQTRLPLPQREKGSRLHPLRMKAKPVQNAEPSHIPEPQAELSSSDEEEDDLTSAAKENDQSLCSSPAKLAPRSPRKNALGKRPLSVLSMPPDLSDIVDTDHHDDMGAMTASEKNIAANVPDSSPQRKSPKLSAFSTAINKNTNDVRVFEDIPGPVGYLQGTTSVDKGNHFRSGSTRREVHSTSVTQQGSQVTINPVPRSRKVSSSSASSSKRKPRVGILRL